MGFLKKVVSLRLGVLILVTIVALLLSMIIGLFELIIEQNERGEIIEKYWGANVRTKAE